MVRNAAPRPPRRPDPVRVILDRIHATPAPMLVVRDVAADEAHNYSGRAVPAGTVLYRFRGALYGVIDTSHGVGLSWEHGGPAFEFPLSAVVPLDPTADHPAEGRAQPPEGS